jgi:two-component system, cell cycle response regulator DivK
MAKSQRTTAPVAAAAGSSTRAQARRSARVADGDIVGRAAERLCHLESFGQMQHASMSAARRPFVLLVQPLFDDGLEMYAEFLRYSGLEPIAVTSAKDALTLAPVADVIVTGIILDNQMDGVELVARLRVDDRTMHKPIIVLTTCAWPQARARAERAECDAFLSKPCLPDALLREVRLLLPTSHDTARSLPQRCRAHPSMTEPRRASA